MEPLLLTPAGKDYLWGGNRLKKEYGKALDLSPLAETWECSTHPDGPSVVLNGAFAGLSLREVIVQHPEFLGDKVEDKTGLPILIKFIDAEKDLSVQVHPDDDFAKAQEGQNGKSEMWYVVDAQEGTRLVHGFAHPVTRDILESAILTGTLERHLQAVPVHKNDVFYIPARTVHAIGAGTLIVEIQESSNVTYRIYDYNRRNQNGKRRELHFEKAMEVLDMSASTGIRQPPRLIHYYPGCSREILCRCQYFETERIVVTKIFSFTVLQSSFQVILCLEGSGAIECENMCRTIRVEKGACVFFPAGLGRCRVLGETIVLKVRC